VHFLVLAQKGWVLMNKQGVGELRLGPSLANQNMLHGEIYILFLTRQIS
jgi:hypothetical protein